MGSLLLQPLAAGTAQAADGCTGATPSTTFICAERILTSAVDSVASVQQLAGASVPVPGPIVVQTNLLDEVNQAAAQVTQAANDCLTNPDSVCAVRVQTSLLDEVNQTVGQAIQEAGNCAAQTDPTCAAIVAAVNQEAQAVQFLVTTCLEGTNDECNQLVGLVGSEVGAFITLAEQCANGQDPTCNTVIDDLSQVLTAAVTCIVGPVSPAAPSTGSPVDVGAACDQVKALASNVVDELVSCASGTSPTCAGVVAAVEGQLLSVLATVTGLAGSFDAGDIGVPAGPVVIMPTPTVGATLHVAPSGSSSEDGAVQATATQPNMTYHAGPVIQSPRYVVTYWGWGSNTTDERAFKSKLEGFLAAVGGSAWQNVQTQYYDTAHGPIQNPAGEYGGAWADDVSSVPSEPNVQQVMNEAAHAVTKHFGFQSNTVDIIVTPPGHDAAGAASRDPSSQTAYCGYHNAVDSADAKAQNARYIYLPYDSISGVCNDNLPALSGLTIVTGHELTEADTDPGPWTGWYDDNQQENGDKCQWGTGKGPGGNGIPEPKSVPFGSTSYWVQPTWSNSGAYCAFSGPAVYYPNVPVTITSQGYGQGPVNSHYASASCTFSPTNAGSGTVSGRLTMSTYVPSVAIPTQEPALSESVRCDVTGGGNAGTFVGTSTANPDAVTSGTNGDGATGTNQVCVSGIAKAADQTIITVPKVCVTF